MLSSLKNKGYILTRENLDFELKNANSLLELFTEYTTEKEKILLFKKRQNEFFSKEFIKIDENYKWLPSLQNTLSKKENHVVLYALNAPPNGILGLVNCLRQEPNGSRIQCFFTFDNNFNFDIKTESTEMAVNVFKNNKRGTYRHLIMKSNQNVRTPHSFVVNNVMGNLSSLKWVEGPLTVHTPISKDQTLVFVSIIY